jgi:hypothetical protein
MYPKKKKLVAERLKTRTDHGSQSCRSATHVIHLQARKSAPLSSASNMCAGLERERERERETQSRQRRISKRIGSLEIVFVCEFLLSKLSVELSFRVLKIIVCTSNNIHIYCIVVVVDASGKALDIIKCEAPFFVSAAAVAAAAQTPRFCVYYYGLRNYACYKGEFHDILRGLFQRTMDSFAGV